MTFQVGRHKTGGRKIGTPNKSTQLLKEAILTAFQEKGGTTYLKQLPDNLFIQLLTKILPRNLPQEFSEDIKPVELYIRGFSDPESIKRREQLDFDAKTKAYKEIFKEKSN